MANCNDYNQSAIQEVRDQLFLDTADGARLDAVTGNLGLDRPGLGFGDDEWRAIAKLVALQPKQIRNAFLRLIEVCLGPQFARIGTLGADAAVGDREFVALDASAFIQRGTMIIDPTLPTEETVDYCIRDLVSQEFLFANPLTFDHTPIEPGDTRLRANIAAGVVSIPVIDSSKLPISGFPYPVMIDRGSLSEEIVQVTANNTGTNTLTIAVATVNAHSGAITQFVRTTLSVDAPQGRTFVKLPLNISRQFPASGWIRIDENGASDEVVQYESNDAEESVLFLKTPLANAHVATESVELVIPGALVEVSQLVELGVHWFLYEPEPRKVTVVLPSDIQILGPLDASWLHDDVAPAFSTTLSDATLTTDTILRVASVSGFPREAGMILVNGVTQSFYTRAFASTDVTASVRTSILAGVQTIPYELADPGFVDFPEPQGPYYLTVNPGGGTEETVQVLVTDTANRTLMVTPALVNPHVAGEPLSLVTQLLLDRDIGGVFGIGNAVALIRVPYAGTNLEDGNSRDVTGNVILNHFPGGYIFDASERGVSEINTQLSVAVPPRANIAVSQIAARTNLEVEDAGIWPAPPFTPFTVRIGEGSGFQEDRSLVDRTLKRDVSATFNGGTIVGATSLTYTLVSAQEFPESDGIFPAGYRLLLSRGTVREEIALVDQNNIGTNVFSLVNPLTLAHNNADTVELINDVLTTDLLTKPHAGPQINPSRDGDTVRPFVSQLTVSPVPTNFPSVGGYVWLNFGKEILNVRKRIAFITSPTSYQLSSTADLPTTGFPYPLTLGDGRFNEEIVFVTANNPGTATLTFQAPGAVNTHVVGEYAKFVSGTPEVVQYNSKLAGPDRLVFLVPLLLESHHLVGERVIYSPAISQSNADGSSYGFKLPGDPSSCLSFLFEFVRAAGIEISIVRS